MPLFQHIFKSILVKQTLLGLLAFLMLATNASCIKNSKTADIVEGDTAPPWTFRRPEDSSHVFGLTRVALGLSETETRDQARQMAFDDLMTQIKRVERRRVYKQGVVKEAASFEKLWQQVLWDRHDALLKGEVTEEWYDEPARNRVWLLISIERTELENLILAQQTDLAKKAEASVQRAEQAQVKGDFAGTLAGWTAAIGYLSGPEGLAVSQNGSLLLTQAKNKLDQALTELTLERVKGPERLRPGESKAILVCELKSSKTGKAVQLPMSFQFAEGQGSVSPASAPTNKGRTTAQLLAVDPAQERVEIRAYPDLAALSGLQQEDLEVLKKSLHTLAIPYAPFPIEIVPIRLLLTYIELGGTGGERGSQLVADLGETFLSAGADIMEPGVQALLEPEFYQALSAGKLPPPSETLQEVDLVGVTLVELLRYTKEGKNPEVHRASGEGVFRLYDLHSQQIKLEVSTGELSFSGFSLVDAERGFFLQTTDQLRDQVIASMESQDILN